MEAEIVTSPERKLIGTKIHTNLSQNRTVELWRGFMPRRKEITNNLNTELISMEIYDPKTPFLEFNAGTFFEKWAAVEVKDHQAIPTGMYAFTVPSGLYAKFRYKGLGTDAGPAFDFIFRTWLPTSGFEVDSRPHYEVMGSAYKKDSPDSEEDLWIPIKPRVV